MRSRTHRRKQDSGQSQTVDQLMKALFQQARMQFGPAVKSFWFHEGEFCPGCSVRTIGPVQFKGEEALAINAFVYRERGVLIGYFLCDVCANFIFTEAEKHPYTQTPLHADIEHNLISAYHKHLSSLNA